MARVATGNMGSPNTGHYDAAGRITGSCRGRTGCPRESCNPLL